MIERGIGRPSVTDEAVGAYVDGMLTERRRLEVEESLACDPEATAFAESCGGLNRRLHASFDHYLLEPLPEAITEIEELFAQRLRRARQQGRVRRVAGLVTAALLIGTGGWIGYDYLFGSKPNNAMFAILDGAVNAHRPLTGGSGGSAGRGAELVRTEPFPAVAQRPPAGDKGAISAPDFRPHGFELIGTRLLNRANVQSVQLVYESAGGARVLLYFGPATGATKQQLTLMQEGAVSVLFWHNAGRAYSMIGEVDRETLLAMGKAVNGEWSATNQGVSRQGGATGANPPADKRAGPGISIPAIQQNGSAASGPASAQPPGRAAPAAPTIERPLRGGERRDGDAPPRPLGKVEQERSSVLPDGSGRLAGRSA